MCVLGGGKEIFIIVFGRKFPYINYLTYHLMCHKVLPNWQYVFSVWETCHILKFWSVDSLFATIFVYSLMIVGWKFDHCLGKIWWPDC